ncbi:MAG: PEGA domain-containing protein [Acidobacteriia bacterium]|nr:PEGA domain-containing protein [Terriglobia bacterium]
MQRTIAIAFLLAALSAAAQDQSSNQQPNRPGGRGGMHAMGNPPKAVTHNGHPALEYGGNQGWGVYIEYFTRQGEPALGFSMAQEQCQGHVYVTRTRISGDFHGTSCESFDVARNGATAEKLPGKVVLTAGSSTYALEPLTERGDERRAVLRMGASAEFLVRSVKNFDKVLANVHRLGTEAQAQASGQSAQQAPTDSSKPQPARDLRGSITITSDPGDVQVYINDEPRGMTSAEGREVLRLPAGTYKLRISLPGFKDFQQEVRLVSGKNLEVTAKLETAGPPPFTAGDVAEMLQGKMSPKRVASLVQERGVDFELNPDLEKRLRGLGASGDLLLAIATNKKK